VDDLRRRLTTNLERFERVGRVEWPVGPPTGDELRRAAVAVAVVSGRDEPPAFLLTRRAVALRAHPGQYALPGGRLDEGESPEATGLRELGEEVGLWLDPAAILGKLDDYVTRTGFCITPVVVWAGDGDGDNAGADGWTIDPAEVSAVHRIPLTTLEEPGAPTFLPGEEPDRPVIQMPVHGHMIHAPTAAILYQFREAALHGRVIRVAHFDQPRFLWR
jgi:8-oxo-dGTP pyrophosphatase MutT (NUDIX family)